MSTYNRYISDEQAIPVVETDLFTSEPDKRFALAILGKGEIPALGKEDVFEAYLRLRANVYIDQTQILEPGNRRSDMTEMDMNDRRSLHLAVVENHSPLDETIRRGISRTAVVGAMRVIEKDEQYPEDLPIEEFFRDELANKITSPGSVEVSRYIVRHEDREHSRVIRALMHATALAYVVQNGLGPARAQVEPALEQSLLRQNIPIIKIANQKLDQGSNDPIVGIQIDTEAYAGQFGRDNIEAINTKPDKNLYWGDIVEGGYSNGNIAS